MPIKKYEKTYEIKSYECDKNGDLRPYPSSTSFLQWEGPAKILPAPPPHRQRSGTDGSRPPPRGGCSETAAG